SGRVESPRLPWLPGNSINRFFTKFRKGGVSRLPWLSEEDGINRFSTKIRKGGVSKVPWLPGDVINRFSTRDNERDPPWGQSSPDRAQPKISSYPCPDWGPCLQICSAYR